MPRNFPACFNSITTNQFTGVAAIFRREWSPAAKVRRGGSSGINKLDLPTKRAVLDFAVIPPRHQRRHSVNVKSAGKAATVIKIDSHAHSSKIRLKLLCKN